MSDHDRLWADQGEYADWLEDRIRALEAERDKYKRIAEAAEALRAAWDSYREHNGALSYSARITATEDRLRAALEGRDE